LTLTVTNVTRGVVMHTPVSNRGPDNDSNGTSIRITK
jgi:hypothetical protein